MLLAIVLALFSFIAILLTLIAFSDKFYQKFNKVFHLKQRR